MLCELIVHPVLKEGPRRKLVESEADAISLVSLVGSIF